jgi:hypothetical protein
MGYDGWSANGTWERAKYLVWKIQTSGGNTIKSTNRASVKELNAVKIFVRGGNNLSKNNITN